MMNNCLRARTTRAAGVGLSVELARGLRRLVPVVDASDVEFKNADSIRPVAV
jgi:hypothetical protein